MAWPSYSTFLLLLYFVVAQHKHVQAYDQELIEQFERILDDKLAGIYDKVNKIDTIQGELEIVKGLLEVLDGDVNGITGRSSASLTATQDAKSMTETLFNEVQEMNNYFEELKNTSLSIEEHIIQVKNLSRETIDLLQQDNELLNNSIEDLINTTAAIEYNNRIQKVVNLNPSNQEISRQLDEIETHVSCPDGFLVSSHCFKFFSDRKRSWEEAKAKCASEGLVLAEPTDSVASPLRKYLLDLYGNGAVWLGARGDGSTHVWQSSHTRLSNDDPAWYPGEPGSRVQTTHCLGLNVWEGDWKRHPGQPYYADYCKLERNTLCEVI